MKTLYVPFRSLALTLVLSLTFLIVKSQGPSVETVNLHEGWLIQSSDSILQGAKEICQTDFNTEGWYPAVVPSTVLHTLVANGVYKDIYLDDNLRKIPSEIFTSSWWYRTEFDNEVLTSSALLKFEGLNYKANIWLNGKLIADTTIIDNAFKQFVFDIAAYTKETRNVLAIEVFPPKKGDFSIGFVDWNPSPPDNNMGLFRNVVLETGTGLHLSNPFVVSNLNNDNSEAKLTASVVVSNYSDIEKQGLVKFSFGGRELSKNFALKAKESRKVVFRNSDFEELIVKNPKIWWPHTVGEPFLYDATFEFLDEQNYVQAKKNLRFGIRTVSDFFTEEGHRGIKVNGKKISIRGGGWVDRLMLEDTYESNKAQLEYVRDMNLNTIRLEGFWGKDQSLYQLCDEMGILVMVGWSCHWEWEDYLGTYCDEQYGGILGKQEIDMMSTAWKDQIIWLRNHPSIFGWVGGSDCIPKQQLEQKYFDVFSEYDSTRIYFASAKEWESESGSTGVKMRGPYAYEPPVYWFADTLYGGAFGFNTETGPGAQVPPLESMEKMISKENLWPLNKVWDYHCGRNEFNTLDRYSEALQKRYGKASSVNDYTRKAQLLNYELMRPMFEAFSAYRYKATGVIQWMLNSAWPETYWQLYDYYLMPNGAYFGAKKASQPQHAIYDYSRNSLFVVNDQLTDKTAWTLKIKVFDFDSKLIFEKVLKLDIEANSGNEIFELPEFKNDSPLTFLDLRLYDTEGNERDINFYWLSKQEDILDYNAEVPNWYYHTPSKQFADFTSLNTLPKVEVSSNLKILNKEGATQFIVELKNETDKVAFFLNPKIVDQSTGKSILPVIWSDNYISLLPNERRIVKATINDIYLKGLNPQLVVEGYNIENE